MIDVNFAPPLVIQSWQTISGHMELLKSYEQTWKTEERGEERWCTVTPPEVETSMKQQNRQHGGKEALLFNH